MKPFCDLLHAKQAATRLLIQISFHIGRLPQNIEARFPNGSDFANAAARLEESKPFASF